MDAYQGITRSFWEITKKDPIITSKEGNFTSHNDGWGYVHYNNSTLEFFRSKIPVFDSAIPTFSSGNLIIHARKAAPGEPVGILASHPHNETNEEYDVFLAHNGWFDKQAIGKEMGIHNVESYVDSQMFLKYIMSFEGEFQNRLKRALYQAEENNFIKTSANLFILCIDRISGNSNIYYYTDVADGLEYSNYVKLYHAQTDKWKGVFSSSIIVPNSFPKNVQLSEVRKGVLNIL
ncbi:MAG: class II glutamine amidotransferase [Thermoplasmatales archaeon]